MIGFVPAAALVLAAMLANSNSGDVPRQETAREQLACAQELRLAYRESRGLKGRREAREAAVEAYEAVYTYHPEEPELGANALFRAGELQRAAGLLRDALRLFKVAQDVSVSSSLRARSLLEVAHVQRRLLAFDEALATYEKVMHEQKNAPKYRDRATFWKARVFLLMEREEDARRVFRGLAGATEDPFMLVRAYDELALSALREDDLEWTAGLIDACRIALADPLREETNVGRKLRIAFRTMRCRARLKAAITKRRRTRTQ